MYRIALHPKAANPENRAAGEFRHSDLVDWTRENRHRLIEAVLTLIRAWFAAGAPKGPRKSRLGSFEAWDRTIDGILGTAGVPGFLENLGDWRAEADYDLSYWVQHVEQLLAQFGLKPFTVAEAVASILQGRISELPPGLESVTAVDYNRKLGRAYGRNKDRWLDGGRLRLVRVGSAGAGGAHDNVNKWAVETSADGSHDDEPGGSGGSGGSVSPTRKTSPSSSPPPPGAECRRRDGAQADPPDPPIPPQPSPSISSSATAIVEWPGVKAPCSG